MWKKIKSLFEFSAKTGLFLPMAYDGLDETPSATLFYTYFSFVMCILSIGFLFFKPDVINPAIFSTLLFVICLTIYRLRRLDNVEIDLDDKSVKLSGHDDQKESKNEK
jgi:hypothetical protein